MLKPEAIKEFKEICLKKTGILLTDEQATEEATSMLNMFKVLFKKCNDVAEFDKRLKSVSQ